MASTWAQPSQVDPAAEPLLPPGLIWVYLVAPVGLALVMTHDLLGTGLASLGRRVACEYVPFLAYGGAFHLVYRHGMPRWLARQPRAPMRLAYHAAAIVLVPAVVALATHPVVEWTAGGPVPFLGFVVISVIVSAACLVPALLLQRLRLRALSAERAALVERQAALQAQLDVLQARTDPHFLFNSLNTVAALIPEDPAKAERALEGLADLFRYALESSRTRAVPLRREVEMVGEYLSLQSARFGDRLRTEVVMEDGLGEVLVPPLLMQPLVENAILHGAARRRGGEVRVSVRRQGDWVVVEVTDDGPGPGSSEHAGSGSALSGVTERIRLHYAGRGGLSLSPAHGGGCVARLRLPLVGVG